MPGKGTIVQDSTNRKQFAKAGEDELRETVSGEVSLMIRSELDIVSAREKGRWLAKEVGFDGSTLTLLLTVISDLARKAISLDHQGTLLIQTLQRGSRRGLAISVAERPLRLGVGDAAARSSRRAGEHAVLEDKLLLHVGRMIADEFEVKPSGRNGALVRLVKWLERPAGEEA